MALPTEYTSHSVWLTLSRMMVSKTAGEVDFRVSVNMNLAVVNSCSIDTDVPAEWQNWHTVLKCHCLTSSSASWFSVRRIVLPPQCCCLGFPKHQQHHHHKDCTSRQKQARNTILFASGQNLSLCNLHNSLFKDRAFHNPSWLRIIKHHIVKDIANVKKRHIFILKHDGNGMEAFQMFECFWQNITTSDGSNGRTLASARYSAWIRKKLSLVKCRWPTSVIFTHRAKRHQLSELCQHCQCARFLHHSWHSLNYSLQLWLIWNPLLDRKVFCETRNR